MTDLNANLNMGFLSSLKDISFPSGYALICVWSSFAQAGGNVDISATELFVGADAFSLAPLANGLPVDPLPLITGATPVRSYGLTTGPIYSGRSVVTTAAGNPNYFVQNLLAIRMSAPFMQITIDVENAAGGTAVTLAAAFLSSLDYASFISVGFNSDTDLASINFKDMSGNAGSCELVGPHVGWTGSMVKAQYFNVGGEGPNVLAFLRTPPTVTGP